MGAADAYNIGFWIGALLPLLVLGLIFWFVGRWGWIGVVIRIVCAALMALRVLAILAVRPPGS